jgi:hypothetical protein
VENPKKEELISPFKIAFWEGQRNCRDKFGSRDISDEWLNKASTVDIVDSMCEDDNGTLQM